MCCGFVLDEMVCLGKLAFPTMLFTTLEMLLLITDMMMLGSVGKDALAVGALGTAFYNMIWYFIEGMLTAQDNLSSQAVGLKNYESLRQWVYVSILVMLLHCVVATVVMLLSPFIVADLFRLHGDMIYNTSLFVVLSIPALWGQAIFRVGQKYLLSRHQLKPSAYCMIVGVLSNIFCNYLFMVVIEGGAAGCAISSSLAKVGVAASLILYMKYSNRNELEVLLLGLRERFKAHKHEISSGFALSGESKYQEVETTSSDNEESEHDGLEMTTPSSKTEEGNEDTDELLPSSDNARLGTTMSGKPPSLHQTKNDIFIFLSLGIPGALVLVVELWTFDIATVIVSQIGNVSVSSQSILILYTMGSFVIIPLAISIASSVRISQLLASQNSIAAKNSALISLFLAAILCLIYSCLFYVFRDSLGAVFTNDPNIVRRCSQLANIFALLQFVNGVQGAAQGIMRGMSRQRELFGYTFLCYWIVGLPLGIYVAFFTRPRFGLYGLWCGLTVGIGLLATALFGIVVSTDWEREVRRAQLRIEKYNETNIPLSWTEGEWGIDARGRMAFITQAASIPGSRALGGFNIFEKRSEEDEIDDFERIEISLPESPRNANVNEELFSQDDDNAL